MASEKVDNIINFINKLPEFHCFIVNGEFILQPMKEKKCPCGSNKKFTSCCLSKANKIENHYMQLKHSKGSSFAIKELNRKIKNYIEKDKFEANPSSKMYDNFLRKKKAAFCLAADSPKQCTSSKINYAHTLSKNPIISILSNKKTTKPITFNRFLNSPKINIEEYFVSIKDDEASVVNTFCKHHDDELFKEIEKNKRYQGQYIQDLQFGLKAIALNVYTNILQILFLQKLLSECEELWLEPQAMKDYYNHLLDLRETHSFSKIIIDSIYNEKDILLTFNYTIPNYVAKFAYCQTHSINKDLENKSIDELTLCMINIFPTKENATQIILSVSNEKGAYSRLFKQLESAKVNNDIKKIIRFFGNIIANSGTNLYFEANYFSSLTEKEKAVLYYSFSKNGAIRIANNLKNKFLDNMNERELADIYIKILFKGLL
ncbi:hypothetical protein P4J23_24600 [Bacillus cereus]|nr:hypothetical protein [Bacillus cereus]